MAIRIITDSAADYSMAEIEKRGITCIPMTINFGEEVYRDGIDITKEEFFEKMISAKELPKTSQPAPSAFVEVFEEAKKANDTVIVILISSELSGTIQSANLAKNIVDYDNIYIVDSKLATLGIRFLVDIAVAMRDKGASVEDIIHEVETIKERVCIYAGLDTLEYLYKGGRISKSVANIGTLANIKPIITFTPEGNVILCGKQIGTRRAIRHMAKYVAEHGYDKNYPVYFVYSYDRTNCAGFIQALQKQGMEFESPKIRGIGATIGTHIGPNAYGMVYVRPEDEI